MAAEAKWYVAHTYSGYENKVKESIEKTVANRQNSAYHKSVDDIYRTPVCSERSVEKKCYVNSDYSPEENTSLQ